MYEVHQKLVGNYTQKQLHKYLKPYNGLHLRPNEWKYNAASTEKYAGGTIG